MIHTVFDAEVIEGQLNILLERSDDDYPHYSRLGLLSITPHYLIAMIRQHRNGELLNQIIWDEEE
jgi:hypothetical protein